MGEREFAYFETRCTYCEAQLRNDGGCSMWYGDPHDLPYRERRDELRPGTPGTVGMEWCDGSADSPSG